MGRRKVPTATPLPKALACGMLEDNGRVLFLVRLDVSGIERIELPSIIVPSGRSAFAEIKNEFARSTGIDGEVHEIVMESRFNAGTRKRKAWVPVLVFKVTARNRNAKPPPSEFSGFKWLSLEDAKKMRLDRKLEWLRRVSGTRPA